MFEASFEVAMLGIFVVLPLIPQEDWWQGAELSAASFQHLEKLQSLSFDRFDRK